MGGAAGAGWPGVPLAGEGALGSLWAPLWAMSLCLGDGSGQATAPEYPARPFSESGPVLTTSQTGCRRSVSS